MDDEENARTLIENSRSEKFTNDKSDKEIHWRHLKPQIVTATLIALITLHCGVNISFSNLIIHSLGLEIGSWYGCIATLAIPVGNVISGVLVDKIGRKKTSLSTAILCSFSWILIFFSNSDQLWLLYTASFLVGFSAGLAHSSMTYVSEISHKNYRPFFLSWVGISYSLGVLSTTAIHLVLTWKHATIIYCGLFLLLAALINFYTPESPYWLITFCQDDIGAKKSMRQLYSNDQVFETEWNLLIESVINSTKTSDRRKLKFTDPIVYKPFCILIPLMLLQQLSGLYLSISFALKIITEISPYQGAKQGDMAFIIFGLSRFGVSILNSFLSKHYGRKTLLICSSLGMVVGCSLLVCIKFITSMTAAYELVAIFAFLAYINMGCIGVGSVPWFLSVELLPTEVRGVGSTVTVALGHLLISCLAKLFPYFLTTIGITGIFFTFGIISAIIFLFTVFFVPETYGKSLSDIEKYFQTKK